MTASAHKSDMIVDDVTESRHAQPRLLVIHHKDDVAYLVMGSLFALLYQ